MHRHLTSNYHAHTHARPCTRTPLHTHARHFETWSSMDWSWPRMAKRSVSPKFPISLRLSQFPEIARPACFFSPLCLLTVLQRQPFNVLHLPACLSICVCRGEGWCGKACSMCLRGARKQARKQAFESAQARGLEQETGRKGVRLPGVCSVWAHNL